MPMPGILGKLFARREIKSVVTGVDVQADGVATTTVIEAFHPLDHDHNGKAGGSLPSDARGLDHLRAELESLGGKPDKRWSDKRLLAEIAARK